MGRISYNYDSKYYVDATVRVDGSSNFAPGYKWGTFPSFALAWRISSEPFMANLNWLSDLKIRGGWGQTGNQETRAFSYLSLVTLKNSAQFGTGAAPGIGIRYIGAYLGDFPSQDLTWETVSTTSLGFDSEILDGKITLTAEYYYRFTDGIIQQIDVPSVIGNISQPVTNLAQVSNQGIELQGSYRDKIGELGYNASFNFTTVDNNVEKIYQGIPTGGNTNRITEGNSINHIFGYKTDGIFQSQQEVDDWLTTIGDPGNDAQKSAGDVIFQDLYGAPEEGAPVGVIRSDSPDNVINGFDRTYLGRTIPGYYYGVNLGLDYKGFDLYLNFRGLGNVQKVFRGGLESISGGGGNYLTDYLNRWTPENTNTNIPRAVHEDPSGNNRFSDRFVHDAGFFRFQNFQVGYNFSSQLLSKVNASNLRVYFSGANIFVLSPFPDLDPENITTPTTFTLGLNLGF